MDNGEKGVSMASSKADLSLLRQNGFILTERRQASEGSFNTNNAPWFADVISERAKELAQMEQLSVQNRWDNRIFNREWQRFILRKYIDNGWTIVMGRQIGLDFWQMYRAARAKAIKDGKWRETPKPKGSHRRVRDTETGKVRIDKGNVKRQKEQAKAKRNNV